MKLRNLRIQQEPQLMIVPMIDIMFFLLVFFMMSSLSMVERHSIPINMPQAATAARDTKRSVEITMMGDGDLMFDQEQIPIQLLSKRVKLALIRQPDQFFILRADKQTPYEKVIAAIDQIKLAGAHRLTLASEVKSR